MAKIYWADIRTILAPGVNCMKNVVIATDEGSFQADLSDYESVKRLHAVIAEALNAWERESDGSWKVPVEATKAHPMPPSRPRPFENVDKFLAWIKAGMPESAPMV